MSGEGGQKATDNEGEGGVERTEALCPTQTHTYNQKQQVMLSVDRGNYAPDRPYDDRCGGLRSRAK